LLSLRLQCLLWAPFSPEAVVTEFVELLKSYRISKVSGDHYGGEWPRERFRKSDIEFPVTYETCDSPKSDIYRDALPLINSGKIELLDNPRLTSQLCGLERRTARSGKDSIDHGPGSHDDIVNSAAGALILAGTAPRGITNISSDLLAKLGPSRGGDYTNYATHLGGGSSYGNSMADLIRSGRA
jgi:hypothetical protein